MVNWKGERKQSWPDLMYCSRICQKAHQESQKHVRIIGLMADILTGGFLTTW